MNPSTTGRWRARYEKARALPIGTVLDILHDKTAERLDRTAFRVQSLLPGYPSESVLRKALRLTGSFDAFVDDEFPGYRNFFLSEDERDEVARVIKEDFGEWATAAKMRADEALHHRFTLLGTMIDTGTHIDWQKDYVSNYAWPCHFSRKIRKVVAENDSDIKYPWELSRFHQGVLLGKAYSLTRNETYAKEFFAQFRDWMLENPPGYGVNWLCTMEVAIRAVNLIWSLFFLKTSVLLDREMKILFLRCMLAHGRYIFKNLEFSRTFAEGRYQPLNGNHYVADLTGLLYISLVFPEFRESGAWFNKAYEELISEIRLQVREDGVHHELSPNYHRLVLEMFLSSLLLLNKQGITVPADAWRNVEKMFDFIYHYTKPDQTVPLVRDIDNGRFHVLGDDFLKSHSHLLPLGAILFAKPYLAHCGPSEDAFWLLGPDVRDRFSPPQRREGPGQTSRGFEESGFYIFRKERLYMLALGSPVGLKGQNGHAHNDFLSFDLFAFDKTFLTDCGSFVYSGQPSWRNRFRSSRSHNTAVIDGREMNPFYDEELFTLRSHADLRVDRWETNGSYDLLEAHYRLPSDDSRELIHRRRFLFLKNDGYWIIKDRFQATDSERHSVDIRFHFGEGIRLNVEDSLSVRTVCDVGANLILIPLSHPEMILTIQTGWVSYVYASKRKIQVARYTYAGKLPAEMTYLLYPVPHDGEQSERFPRISSYNDYATVREKRSAILQNVEALEL
jgi:hypothetical protein